MARELSKETIQFWRNMSVDPAFLDGIVYLRTQRAPRLRAANVAELIENACKASGYQEALDDIMDTLTHIEIKPPSLDEAPLL